MRKVTLCNAHPTARRNGTTCLSHLHESCYCEYTSAPTASEQAPFFPSTVMANGSCSAAPRCPACARSPECTGPTLWYAHGTLLTLDRRRKVSCAVGRAQLPPVRALSGNRHDYDHAAQLAAEQSVSFAKKKRFALRRRPLDAPDVRALTLGANVSEASAGWHDLSLRVEHLLAAAAHLLEALRDADPMVWRQESEV